jgi:predicted aspartyl protease
MVTAALCPPFARGAVVAVGQASRLTPLDERPYLPPTSISTVADIYRRMTAPIKVDEAGPFAFVVDTGANQSVISRELADQLGLPLGSTEPLNGVAGVTDAPTTVADLRVGARRQAKVVLSVLPAQAIGGHGMLGLDRLDGLQLTLNFRGQRLDIQPPRRLIRDPDDIAVKARRRNGQLTLVDADLAGIPLVAFLDSGAENTIGNMALRSLALSRNPATLWSQTPIVSATGQTIAAEIADLPALRVGGLRLPNWPVAFADLHTFQMWRLTERPAILLGVDVLSRFESVCLDFSRNEVRFRLPPRTW